MPRKSKPILREPDPVPTPFVQTMEAEIIGVPKVDYMALLRDICALPFTKEISHAKADIILMASMASGQFTPAMAALAFQAKIAGYLVDKTETDVRVIMTVQQRRERIAELVQKAGYAPRLVANG